MLFNSLEFLLFFPAVTALFFLLPHRWRWLLLLGASCAFYMAFIPVYILILVVTILIDYFAGRLIADSHDPRRKRLLLIVSIVSTCLVLFVFKYFNFFNQNAEALARFLGWNYPVAALNLILPIGLSFHTFQSLSYVVEVYRGRQTPERHFGSYSLYVMFYPQLVAGPIERPQNLLHQFREVHRFNYEEFTSGLRLMAWGFFKKLVIADRLAAYVNAVYAHPGNYSGLELTLATLAFAYQIYCDFSGYSDIAIGAARTMGFKLMTNFDSPYLSQSIAEFWKRWHISLSTWFRDYLYIPLGGNRVNSLRWCFNIIVVFAVSGLWHGANWTYVIWGALNGFYLLAGVGLARFAFLVPGPLRVRPGAAVIMFKVLVTFLLTCVAWIFFRANHVGDAWHILTHLGRGWGNSLQSVDGFTSFDLAIALSAVVLLEAVQISRRLGRPRITLERLPLYVRWPVYYAFLFAVLTFATFQARQFIYFQF